MADDVPKCPRCKDGGNVTLIFDQEDKTIFDLPSCTSVNHSYFNALADGR